MALEENIGRMGRITLDMGEFSMFLSAASNTLSRVFRSSDQVVIVPDKVHSKLLRFAHA